MAPINIVDDLHDNGHGSSPFNCSKFELKFGLRPSPNKPAIFSCRRSDCVTSSTSENALACLWSIAKCVSILIRD